ncbi:hypothetical protein OESDEN_12518, partial [Oesophagostomum dentatum]
THWPLSDWNSLGLTSETAKAILGEIQIHSVAEESQYISPIRFRATRNYLKLVRSTVYVLKFILALCLRIRRRPSTFSAVAFSLSKLISAEEIKAAEHLLIIEHYRESEAALDNLPLEDYNIYVSEEGYIRCRNRLEHCNHPSVSPAPILLVPDHPFTESLIMYTHKTNYHSGVHATIASLRQNFFVPFIKTTVSKLLRSCIVCRKANCLAYRYPSMPSLPKERVTRSRPFQKVGLDYLGPLRYKGQFHEPTKIWICLFTCMATRAVHLELVHSNSTQEFILAFRRFIARRGTPDYIVSDNSTTFCSASDTLESVIYARSSVKRLSSFYANKKIVWKFITPLILRPVDFISPEVDLQLPSVDHSSLSLSSHRLSDWYKETTQVLDRFWDLWYKDYLRALSDRRQTRLKQGRSTPRAPKVSDVVLVADKNVPRGQWRLGVITSVKVDDNNVARSAEVRMSNGHILSRSLNHLYPLEISADDSETPAPVTERKPRLPTRIQPPRAVKHVRSYSR